MIGQKHYKGRTQLMSQGQHKDALGLAVQHGHYYPKQNTKYYSKIVLFWIMHILGCHYVTPPYANFTEDIGWYIGAFLT